jgi:biopolymer transport protein ExbD
MRYRTRKKNPPEINMIPMIDVIMMLLIFFLIATQMKKEESSLELVLPDSAQALMNVIAENEPQPLIINVLSSKEAPERPYVVQGVPMNQTELAPVLKVQAKKQWEANGEQASVRMRCDRSAEFIELQEALRACQTANIIKVFIAAEKR